MDHSLAARLARVRRRVDDAVPYSPEWAAAMDELEELEAAVASGATSDRELYVVRPAEATDESAAAGTLTA